MKLKCLQCGCEYEGSIARDNMGFYSSCPHCEGSFDVDVPAGRYAIAIAAENAERHTKVLYEKSEVINYFALDSAEALLSELDRIAKETNVPWLWLLDDGTCFYGGAYEGAAAAIKTHLSTREKVVIFRSDGRRFIDMVLKVENFDDNFHEAAARAADLWRHSTDEYSAYVLNKLRLAGYRCEFVECEYFDDD